MEEDLGDEINGSGAWCNCLAFCATGAIKEKEWLIAYEVSFLNLECGNYISTSVPVWCQFCIVLPIFMFELHC